MNLYKIQFLKGFFNRCQEPSSSERSSDFTRNSERFQKKAESPTSRCWSIKKWTWFAEKNQVKNNWENKQELWLERTTLWRTRTLKPIIFGLGKYRFPNNQQDLARNAMKTKKYLLPFLWSFKILNFFFYYCYNNFELSILDLQSLRNVASFPDVSAPNRIRPYLFTGFRCLEIGETSGSSFAEEIRTRSQKLQKYAQSTSNRIWFEKMDQSNFVSALRRVSFSIWFVSK